LFALTYAAFGNRERKLVGRREEELEDIECLEALLYFVDTATF